METAQTNPGTNPAINPATNPEQKLSRLLALLTDSNNPLGPSTKPAGLWQSHTENKDHLRRLATTMADNLAQQDSIECAKHGLAGHLDRFYDVSRTMITEDRVLITLTAARPDAAWGKIVPAATPAAFYLMKTKAGAAKSHTETSSDPADALATLARAIAHDWPRLPGVITVGGKQNSDTVAQTADAIQECVVQRLHTASIPIIKNLDENTVAQFQFLELDPQAGIFLAEYHPLESIGPDREFIFQGQAQTGFVFCERGPEQGRPAPDTTVTALVTGTQETMDNAAAKLGLTPIYVETGDNHHMAPYTDGPAILAHISNATQCQNPPDWQDLTHQEKKALISLAANSTWWYEGQIDQADQDRMLLDSPSLREKLTSTDGE